jgi:hypothetical protein
MDDYDSKIEQKLKITKSNNGSLVNLHTMSEETLTECKFNNDSIMTAYKKPKLRNINEIIKRRHKRK